MISVIISGGQTGADRAALDAAIAWGVPVRGWVPRGRLAEDGAIPPRYPCLLETESSDPGERTHLNVRDADGTLILSHGNLDGGSRVAAETAADLHRPALHLDLDSMTMSDAVRVAVAWIHAHHIRELGVGGPRATDDPDIYTATASLMGGIFAALGDED